MVDVLTMELTVTAAPGNHWYQTSFLFEMAGQQGCQQLSCRAECYLHNGAHSGINLANCARLQQGTGMAVPVNPHPSSSSLGVSLSRPFGAGRMLEDAVDELDRICSGSLSDGATPVGAVGEGVGPAG